MEETSYLHESVAVIADCYFGCDYCPETFPSQKDRTSHTTTHFKNKSCTTCKKLLICINNDWYELHPSINCDTEPNKPNLNDIDVVTDIKAEAIVETVYESSLKFEENIYSSDESRQFDTFEQSPELHSQIEVNPLPEIVKSAIKVESSARVSKKTRNRSKKLITSDVFAKKRKKSDVKSVIKMEIKTHTKEKLKKRKPVTNKATFLDHRPKSTCICDICNKTLGNFSSLRNHMIHLHCLSEKSERVSCEECGQTFSTPGNLNSHKKIHLKCKAYVCTYCGRGFNQLHNLKEHTNRHTGDRPYKCETCGKSFGRKTNLTAHTRVHTGQKPFKCNIEECSRAYMFEIDLKRHKYSIHGIFTKKHICPICSKVYPENKLLKKHLESHSTGFN